MSDHLLLSSGDSSGRKARSRPISETTTAQHSSLSTASKLAVLRVAKAKAKITGAQEGQSHRRFHIAFHLKPQEKAIPVSSAAFKKLVHDEYLSKYLETLGVTPTRQTLEKARLQLPQDELKVAAAWKSDMVTVSPLERAAVFNNNRLHAAAAKARLKESRAQAEKRKLEREAEKAEEQQRRGRRRDRITEEEESKDAFASSQPITTSVRSSPPRARSRSRPNDRPPERSTTLTRPIYGASVLGLRSSRASYVPLQVRPPAAGLAAHNDVISSVLSKQEAVFEAMRSALDHRRRMGDRDEEIARFWEAAQTKDEEGAGAAAAASAAAQQTLEKKKLAEEEKEKDTPNSDSAADTPSTSVPSSTAPSHPTQLLQVFTLYHFLHAHNFSTQTRRSAIMAHEESSIAGENVLKKKSQQAINLRGLTPAEQARARMREKYRPVDVKLIYWRPKTEDFTSQPHSTPAEQERMRRIAQAQQQQEQQVVVRALYSDEHLDLPDDDALPNSVPRLLSQPSASTGPSFGPLSRSFSALSQLFHSPFHASLVDISHLARIFLELFPRYRNGIERNWNELEAHYGVQSAPVAQASVGGVVGAWTEKGHDEFGLVNSNDGSQLSLSIGAAASIVSSQSLNASSFPETSQPSKLQSFYSEAEFQALLGQAGKILTQERIGQLIGLLGHYLYWKIFAKQLEVMRRYRTQEAAMYAGDPVRQAALPHMPADFSQKDLDTILLTLQKIFIQLDHRLRKLQHYSLFFLPLLMDLICTCTLNLFHQSYPAWFQSQYGYNTDQTIMRMCDRLFDVHLLSAVPDSMPGTIRPHISAQSPTPSSTLTSSTLHSPSLFFHTSSLVKRAVPQPKSEGARRLRKEDARREWEKKLHMQQLALAVRNGERREEAKRQQEQAARLAQKSTDAPSPSSSRPPTGLLLHTRDSLLSEARSRSSTARARVGGDSFAARREWKQERNLMPQASATARVERIQPATGAAYEARPPSSARAQSASDQTAGSRAMLFDLALRKITNRHAREHTAVRNQVAKPPGTDFQPGVNATPRLAMHRVREAAERRRSRSPGKEREGDRNHTQAAFDHPTAEERFHPAHALIEGVAEE